MFQRVFMVQWFVLVLGLHFGVLSAIIFVLYTACTVFH
jgi:hypothetical protein